MEITKLTPLLDELRFLENINMDNVLGANQILLRNNKVMERGEANIVFDIDESLTKLIASYLKTKINHKQKELKKALEKING